MSLGDKMPSSAQEEECKLCGRGQRSTRNVGVQWSFSDFVEPEASGSREVHLLQHPARSEEEMTFKRSEGEMGLEKAKKPAPKVKKQDNSEPSQDESEEDREREHGRKNRRKKGEKKEERRKRYWKEESESESETSCFERSDEEDNEVKGKNRKRKEEDKVGKGRNYKRHGNYDGDYSTEEFPVNESDEEEGTPYKKRWKGKSSRRGDKRWRGSRSRESDRHRQRRNYSSDSSSEEEDDHKREKRRKVKKESSRSSQERVRTVNGKKSHNYRQRRIARDPNFLQEEAKRQRAIREERKKLGLGKQTQKKKSQRDEGNRKEKEAKDGKTPTDEVISKASGGRERTQEKITSEESKKLDEEGGTEREGKKKTCPPKEPITSLNKSKNPAEVIGTGESTHNKDSEIVKTITEEISNQTQCTPKGTGPGKVIIAGESMLKKDGENGRNIREEKSNPLQCTPKGQGPGKSSQSNERKETPHQGEETYEIGEEKKMHGADVESNSQAEKPTIQETDLEFDVLPTDIDDVEKVPRGTKAISLEQEIIEKEKQEEGKTAPKGDSPRSDAVVSIPNPKNVIGEGKSTQKNNSEIERTITEDDSNQTQRSPKGKGPGKGKSGRGGGMAGAGKSKMARGVNEITPKSSSAARGRGGGKRRGGTPSRARGRGKGRALFQEEGVEMKGEEMVTDKNQDVETGQERDGKGGGGGRNTGSKSVKKAKEDKENKEEEEYAKATTIVGRGGARGRSRGGSVRGDSRGNRNGSKRSLPEDDNTKTLQELENEKTVTKRKKINPKNDENKREEENGNKEKKKKNANPFDENFLKEASLLLRKPKEKKSLVDLRKIDFDLEESEETDEDYYAETIAASSSEEEDERKEGEEEQRKRKEKHKLLPGKNKAYNEKILRVDSSETEDEEEVVTEREKLNKMKEKVKKMREKVSKKMEKKEMKKGRPKKKESLKMKKIGGIVEEEEDLEFLSDIRVNEERTGVREKKLMENPPEQRELPKVLKITAAVGNKPTPQRWERGEGSGRKVLRPKEIREREGRREGPRLTSTLMTPNTYNGEYY